MKRIKNQTIQKKNPKPSSNIPIEDAQKDDPSNNLNTVENQDLPIDHPIQKTIEADDEQKANQEKANPQHDHVDDDEREEQSSDSEDD